MGKAKRVWIGLLTLLCMLCCAFGLVACGGGGSGGNSGISGGSGNSGSYSSESSESESEVGSSESSESSEKHNHAYVTQVTAPTCTAWGYTTYTCECGDSYVGDYVEATGHTYAEEWSFDETHHWHAATCGHTDEISNKAEHDLQDGIHCSVCDFIQVTPAAYFTFTLKVDDTYEITAKDINNLPAKIVLPSVYEGKAVTSIGGWAFFDCSRLTSVVIPDSVTSIGKEAFACCSSLTSITIDENNASYKSIDGNLYTKDGTTLIQYAIGKTATSFVIPDSVTSIGAWAFAYCSSLTSVTIGNSVTSIGEAAFSGCSSLTRFAPYPQSF